MGLDIDDGRILDFSIGEPLETFGPMAGFVANARALTDPRKYPSDFPDVIARDLAQYQHVTPHGVITAFDDGDGVRALPDEDALTVLPCPGAKGGIFAVQALVNYACTIIEQSTGKFIRPAVVVPTPTFESTPAQTHYIMRGKVLRVPIYGEGWTLDLQKLDMHVKAHAVDIDCFPALFINVSPHPVTGGVMDRPTAEKINAIFSSMNERRLGFLKRKAGGKNQFGHLMQTNKDFAWAVGFLSRINIVSDGVYEGSHRPSFSFMELWDKDPDLVNHVFEVRSASKGGGDPSSRGGLTVCAKIHAEKLRYIGIELPGDTLTPEMQAAAEFFSNTPEMCAQRRAFINRRSSDWRRKILMMELLCEGRPVHPVWPTERAYAESFLTGAAYLARGIQVIPEVDRGGMFVNLAFDQDLFTPVMDKAGIPPMTDFYKRLKIWLERDLSVRIALTTGIQKRSAPGITQSAIRMKIDVPEADLRLFARRLSGVVGLAPVPQPAASISSPTRTLS